MALRFSKNVLFIVLLSSLCFIAVGKKTKCEICKEMVDNFNKGMTNTMNSNYGGGNTHWEEKRSKSYLNSETRFIEITDNLCENSGDKPKCNGLFEEYEDDLEDWWEKDDRVDLLQYLCFDKMKACCELNHFGASCEACPGGPVSPCSGNGKCAGSGDKEGKGVCECNEGYEDELCSNCKDGYFDETEELTKTDDVVICKKCHESCKLTCSGSASKDCDECKQGWSHSDEEGCIDIDECKQDSNPCRDVQYCENTIGSYSCNKCDAACATCTSKGAGSCTTCAPRYHKDDNGVCTACHQSCDIECSGPDASQCSSCRLGWEIKPDMGCVDVNECENDMQSCKTNQYCKNNEGSYKCLSCDKSCKSCTASGATSCKECNDGYHFVDKVCLDIDECNDSPCTGDNEKCKNEIGSYKCNCEEGYKRESKKSSKCVKKSDKPTSKKKKLKLSKDSENLKKKEL